MSLQTSLTTRRKFLERSALGAGGLLFSPMLLQSCMKDHIIPNPDNPPLYPPELGLEIDWNDDAKIMVTSVIEMIPEAGDILGGLVDIFWPSTKPEGIWDQIKDQVEAIVDQKIAASVYQQVSEDLQGLKNALTLYLNEVKNGNAENILSQWIATRTVFVNALPHFQSQGNQLPLLGLFAQFANMYLGLLRDAVIAGKSWGRTDADHQQDTNDLFNSFNSFYNYVSNTVDTGRSALEQTAPNNPANLEPFKTLNAWNRQMTLTVLDFKETWVYYYETALINMGAEVNLPREIYMDPWGSSTQGVSPWKTPPTQFPTLINVWADRGGIGLINAVQLGYPAYGGPNGWNNTDRMGDPAGGNTAPPAGGSFTLSPTNPFIAARAVSDGVHINGMQFMSNDGTTTPLMGGFIQAYDSGLVGYPNEALSSIMMEGNGSVWQQPVWVLFGFKFWKSPAVQLNALRTHYIKSPKERSAADFAKQFPKLSIPANLITEELKAARKAHWDAIEARAKALK